ncbi:MAG: ubiquitin-like protein Pup [Acidimicrobiia bacterium]|nr:ubiquitin-like protein Pup [Acidimicrobiia bacterium]
MAEQERRQVSRREEPAEDIEDLDDSGVERAEKLKEETDELLDEIDAVLEENAEEFVRNYIQKGGE